MALAVQLYAAVKQRTVNAFLQKYLNEEKIAKSEDVTQLWDARDAFVSSVRCSWRTRSRAVCGSAIEIC